MLTSNRFPIEEQFSQCEPREPGRIHVLDLNENILRFSVHASLITSKEFATRVFRYCLLTY